MIEQAKHPDMCKPKRKRLKFEKSSNKFYVVFNKKNEHLGDITYNYGWKMFVWEQAIDIDMSWDCLQEVVDFMKMLEAVK